MGEAGAEMSISGEGELVDVKGLGREAFIRSKVTRVSLLYLGV